MRRRLKPGILALTTVGSDRMGVIALRVEDLSSLFELYAKVMAFPPHHSIEKYWNWRFRDAHFGDRGPSFWVIRQSDEVVGTLATPPAIVDVEGHPTPAQWTADFMVHPAFRGRGLGKILFDHYRGNSELAISTGYPPDSVTSKVARTVGFHGLPPFRYLFKFFSVQILSNQLPYLSPVISSLSRISRPILRMWGQRSIPTGPIDCVLHEIDRFNPDIDSLWQRVSRALPVSVRRTHQTLNWRYFDNPLYRYRAVEARRGGELVGCVVLKVMRDPLLTYGTIPELIAEGGDRAVQETLLGWALDRFRREQVDVVKTLATRPDLNALFRDFGFVPLGKGCDFVISAHGKSPEVLYDHHQWYLTKGDSDLDITPDFRGVVIGDGTSPKA